MAQNLHQVSEILHHGFPAFPAVDYSKSISFSSFSSFFLQKNRVFSSFSRQSGNPVLEALTVSQNPKKCP